MIKRILLLFALATLGLFAQNPTKLVDGNGNEVQHGAAGKKFESAFTAISSSGTTITSITTQIQLIYCTNNTGSNSTLSLQDGSGNFYMTTSALNANSVILIGYGTIGLTFTSGIKITAGANATISCQVKGVQ